MRDFLRITLLMVVLAFVAVGAQAQSYAVTDLGTLGGSSTASAISGSGLVVGSSEVNGGNEHAFLWSSAHGMIDVGLLHSDDLFSVAYGVNRSGTVVGESGGFGFLWTKSGGMQDLGNLGGTDTTTAYGINDSGQVVGTSFLPNNAAQHAFLWTAAEGMQDLGTLGGNSIATAINNSEQVVGYSYLSDNAT